MLSADLMSGQWRNIPTESGKHETNQICAKPWAGAAPQ